MAEEKKDEKKDDKKKEKKTAGQIFGGVLVIVLLFVLFLMAIDALFGVGFGALTSIGHTVAVGASQSAQALIQGQIGIKLLSLAVLMIMFAIAVTAVFIKFIIYIVKKIMDEMND